MPHELEVFVIHEVKDILPLSGKKIIQTDDKMTFLQQFLAEVRA